MVQEIDIKVFSDELDNELLIRHRALQQLRLPESRVKTVRVVRRSIDARGQRPFFLLKVKYTSTSPTNHKLLFYLSLSQLKINLP